MKYPEKERILIVRPCLKAICLGIRPASKLLSLLLFYAKDCDEQEPLFTFSCNQEELVADLIEEMDVKTLHRTAVPMLRLLGFIEVDGSSYRYRYTVHLDLIQHAINHHKNKEQLDKILIVSMREQLDKYRNEIDKCPNELDKILIELDKCLIPFRKMSNSIRGRKPRPKEALTSIPKTLDNLDSFQIDSDSFGDGSSERIPVEVEYPLLVANGIPETSKPEETRGFPGSPMDIGNLNHDALLEEAMNAPTEKMVAVAAPKDGQGKQPEGGEVESPQEEVRQVEVQVLIPPPQEPEMPPLSAKWPNRETAIRVAQAIRERIYTDKQLKDERKAAEKMFKDYPTLTREQFTTIFTESLAWWKEHDQGLFTIGTLMSKSKATGKVHLERSLEILEQRKGKSSNGQGKPDEHTQRSNGYFPPSLQGLEDFTYAPPQTVIPREYRTAAASARR